MYAAKIIGNVVSTCKERKMEGFKLLIVQPVNLVTLKEEGKPVVAVDAVGAGENELVLVVAGSSARQTDMTNNKPVDAAISGVIDYINIGQKRVFDKARDNVSLL